LKRGINRFYLSANVEVKLLSSFASKCLFSQFGRPAGISLTSQLKLQYRSEPQPAAFSDSIRKGLGDEVTVALLTLRTVDERLHAFRKHLPHQDPFELAGQFRWVTGRNPGPGPLVGRQRDLWGEQFPTEG
jgi:hypothetical protein